MSEFGQTLFFIMSLVGLVAIAGIFLPYSAHSFLTVLEQSAAGNDEVAWPDEPLVDWLWKPLFLAWLLSVWFALVWFHFVLVAPAFARSPLGAVIALGVATWLFFPISLFSALSTSSRLIIFYPPLFKRLAGVGLAVAISYGLTGLLMATALGAILLAVLGRWYFVPLGAFLSMTIFLIYARVLGRFGWLLSGGGVKASKARKQQSMQEEASTGPARDSFPAPLPTLAQPTAAMVQPTVLLPAALREGIQADAPLPVAQFAGPGGPPAPRAIPVDEDDDVPTLDIEEVAEEPTFSLAAAPAELGPIPLMDDLPPLSLEGPELRIRKGKPAAAHDAPLPLGDDFGNEPGLVPLDDDHHAPAEPPQDLTPYGVQEDPRPSWRVEAAVATASPIKPDRVEGYGLDPTQTPPSKTPIPLDGYWPPELDRRPDLGSESPRPISLEYKMRLRRDKPIAPVYPFLQGVFNFPFYVRSLRALVYLTLLWLVELLFLRLMVSTFPPVD